MSSTNIDLHSDVCIIVRSTGERTEAACVHSLKQQVVEKNIVVLHERPFVKALRRGFEIGLDYGLDWTFCVDADVILKANAVDEILSFAETVTENTFDITPSLLDKLLGEIRPVGIHVYRTQYFDEVLKFVNEAEYEIRPDTFVKRKMESKGYIDVFTERNALGLHDYEQYYADIYRKGLVHARKFSHRMAYAVDMWERLKADDPDFAVALMGYRASQIFVDKHKVDRNMFPERIDDLLHLQGLKEKDELLADSWSAQAIDETITNFTNPPELQEWLEEGEMLKTTWGSVRLLFQYYKLLSPLWLVGRQAEVYGKRLQRWVIRRSEHEDS